MRKWCRLTWVWTRDLQLPSPTLCHWATSHWRYWGTCVYYITKLSDVGPGYWCSPPHGKNSRPWSVMREVHCIGFGRCLNCQYPKPSCHYCRLSVNERMTGSTSITPLTDRGPDVCVCVQTLVSWLLPCQNVLKQVLPLVFVEGGIHANCWSTRVRE